MLRAFLPPMRAQGRGLVVTIGSVADHQALPGNAAYGAAKHGLRGLHGVLAQELRGSGVRATLLSPGPVDTALWDPVDPDGRPGFTRRAAMLRSEDVAEAVLFVATRPEQRDHPRTAHRTETVMRRPSLPALLAVLALAAAPVAARAQARRTSRRCPIPRGWGVHILSLARAPDGAIWVGTLRRRHLRLTGRAPGSGSTSASDTTVTSISWDFVHAFAFGPHRAVWYGTVGNGWGLSRDGGRTWRNWQFRDLGPKWQYVAPNGIVVAPRHRVHRHRRRHPVHHGSGAHLGARSATPAPARCRAATCCRRGRPATAGCGSRRCAALGAGAPAARRVRADPSPVPALGARVRAIFVVDSRTAVVPVVLGGERCAGGLRPKRRRRSAASGSA